jgi:predicted Rdx family selenoprotein
MKKFVIEREIPEVGKNTPEGLRNAAAHSNQVLDQLGKGIQWVTSYVTDNKLFCVYLADDEKIIREHAAKSGFPASKVHEVRTVIDPTTANA